MHSRVDRGKEDTGNRMHDEADDGEGRLSHCRRLQSLISLVEEAVVTASRTSS